MTVDEARRIKTMMRKMTETKHQDEASAVLTQLHRRAALHGLDLAHLVAEAESTLKGKPPAAPEPDPPVTKPAAAPEAAPESAAPRPRSRHKPGPRRDDGASLQRHLASWQDTVLLIVLLGIVFYAVLFGREPPPPPPTAVVPEPVYQRAPNVEFQ